MVSNFTSSPTSIHTVPWFWESLWQFGQWHNSAITNAMKFYQVSERRNRNHRDTLTNQNKEEFQKVGASITYPVQTISGRLLAGSCSLSSPGHIWHICSLSIRSIRCLSGPSRNIKPIRNSSETSIQRKEKPCSPLLSDKQGTIDRICSIDLQYC